MAYQSINPADFKLLAEFVCISDSELNDKLNKSVAAYQFWSKTDIKFRLNLIRKIAEKLMSDFQFHAELISLEMGKPITQSKMEIQKCAALCHYYCEKAEELLKPIHYQENDRKSMIVFEPMGIVYGVMPWNFPYWQVFRFFIPNLILGNVCLLKHASNVPQCALNIEKVVSEAGVQEGVFANLFINYNQSEAVINHPAVCGVTLTGSEAAGAKVAELAGKNIKKSVLELGGSDPFIVLPDANLDKAVEIGIFARMQNAGQSCIAAKRFIIHEQVYDEFRHKYIAAAEKMKIGNPLDTETDLGPLARPYLLDELVAQIEKSVNMGATIATGGKILHKNKLFFEPTVIENVTEGMPAFHEEIFGPVAVFFKFKTLEEAIELANITEFGLGASVWTQNIEQGLKLAGQINSGIVAVNGLVKSSPDLPFGGTKKSGFGRELGEAGLKEFSNIKTINIF